jgi:hypothetical protein
VQGDVALEPAQRGHPAAAEAGDDVLSCLSLGVAGVGLDQLEAGIACRTDHQLVDAGPQRGVHGDDVVALDEDVHGGGVPVALGDGGGGAAGDQAGGDGAERGRDDRDVATDGHVTP